ncbi:hypothetical protein [Vibrio vulnificus]|uniref:hypothetical protein n=1 Tax=Vibrio vulnificus TaxID=672 RepID=UPI003ED8AC8E
MCLVSSFFLSVSFSQSLRSSSSRTRGTIVQRVLLLGIAASLPGFALCSCWLWQVRFQTWHLACVDEWIPVCTGMTTGGVARCDEISVSATFLEVLIHFYFPSLNLYIEY